MPLPVIADVFQATLVWVNGDAPRAATNTIHFRDTVGTQTEANLFADIAASVTTGMWTPVGQHSVITEVKITKLDGISAGQVFAPAAAAKWTGQGATDVILQGAVVVSLRSVFRGPSGRNRVFLPWVGETQQQNGALVSPVALDTVTAWSNFKTAMVALGWEMVTVSPLNSNAAAVSSMSVRSIVNTQRRRARR